MQYRENIKNGDKLSALGYGCMRFPMKGFSIDFAATDKLVRMAINQGVNYFDTAYIYNMGQSEAVLGKILCQDQLRDKVKLATKLPHYMVSSISDVEKIFKKHLERLRTDRIDYYLIHMLSHTDVWERLKGYGIEQWIDQKKQSGQIVNIGFSFHGGKDMFLSLVDSYDWDFVQIQYNYLDENNQAGKQGLEYAHSKGLPVIIMCPLRGGTLTKKSLPKDAIEAMKPYTPPELSFRHLWNHKEVTVVLSGMSKQEDLEQNIATANSSSVGSFGADQQSILTSVRKILLRDIKVPCTGCGYCMPCPVGVDIPTCFSCYNDKYTKTTKTPSVKYFMYTSPFSKKPKCASSCIACGKCEKLCPQSIKISQQLKLVKKEMENPIYALFRKITKI